MEKHKIININGEIKQSKKGRIEMKVKTKSIIALMIALFAVMLIGATKVNAVEVTDEYLQNMLNTLPSEISVNVKETEWEKASDLASETVKNIWKEKGIDLTGIETSIYNNPLYQSTSVEDFHKVIINVAKNGDYQNNKQTTIKLKYNNTNNYSSADEQTVKNLKIQIFPYAVYDFTSGKEIRGYYSTTNSDKSIQIIESAGAGGEDNIHNISGEGLTLGIFKNNILYDIKSIGHFEKIGQITIPSTVAEQDYTNYATNIIKDKLKIDNITITKGAKTSGNKSVEIEDGYTVTTQTEYGKETGAIILKKEKATTPTTEPVTKEDTATGIKLETTTAVVPSNTILSSVTVTEQKTLDTVNKALKDTTSKYKVYDINLLKDGAKIQPNGKVKVSIPIPSDYDKSKLEVYRIDDNGTKTKYNVTVNGEYASFETDHFSIYALAEKQETTNNQTANKGEKDETPKTGIQDITYIITAVVIISAVGIIATIKRKQSKH